MLKLALSNMALAMLMFIAGGTSGAAAFAIWGCMFMLTATTITIVGTSRHGS